MLRFLDIVLSVTGLVLGAPLLLLIFLLGLADTGAPLFRQVRLGRHQRPFVLIKFRTMRPGTASVASHLADPAAITPLGRLLRRTKLDELPQLWNVLKGEMSLVGPRPGLPAQTELTRARERLGIYAVRPGITGLALLRHVYMDQPERVAACDREMLDTLDLRRYCGYILRTALGRGAGDAAGP